MLDVAFFDRRRGHSEENRTARHETAAPDHQEQIEPATAMATVWVAAGTVVAAATVVVVTAAASV